MGLQERLAGRRAFLVALIVYDIEGHAPQTPHPFGLSQTPHEESGAIVADSTTLPLPKPSLRGRAPPQKRRCGPAGPVGLWPPKCVGGCRPFSINAPRGIRRHRRRFWPHVVLQEFLEILDVWQGVTELLRHFLLGAVSGYAHRFVVVFDKILHDGFVGTFAQD